MKQPFKHFVCDVCGREINTEDGMLQWLQKPAETADASPSEEELVSIHICCRHSSCYGNYESRARREDLHEQWVHLEDLAGPEDLDELFSFPLERKISQNTYVGFLEILRRLEIPHYEEARKYFSRANEDGLIIDLNGYINGHQSWRQDLLKQIIEEYSHE